MKKHPLAWASASDDGLRKVRGVALDIDDTLSTDGQLTAEAYESLWRLQRAGYAVVPITGRPAGWCDLIARFWPVNAVVGENGAFTFFREDGVRKRIDTPGAESNPTVRRARLNELELKIRARFPTVVFASDQAYREHDLAIDICEDVPVWPRSEIDALLALCAEAGAHAKLSSIHVNAWFGEYDKRRGMEHWLAQGKLAVAWDEWLFIGDSPNDEPLFAAFPQTVGVANLRQYLDRLKNPPTWITDGKSGTGFVEMADRLVRLRV